MYIKHKGMKIEVSPLFKSLLYATSLSQKTCIIPAFTNQRNQKRNFAFRKKAKNENSIQDQFRVVGTLVTQSCLTLQRVDCSPPGSSVHGVLLARILEWAAMPSSRVLPQPGAQTRSPPKQAHFLSKMLKRQHTRQPRVVPPSAFPGNYTLPQGPAALKTASFCALSWFILIFLTRLLGELINVSIFIFSPLSCLLCFAFISRA